MNNQLKLHLIWSKQINFKTLTGAYIWAESAAESKAKSSGIPSIDMHPQAASADDIKAALKRALPKQKNKTKDRRVFIWMPSHASAPYTSEVPIATQDSMPIGKWWEVEALYLEGQAILDMLEKKEQSGTYTFGPSWDFWREVKDFVSRLIANQSFLPTINAEKLARKTRYWALWQPSPLRHEVEQLNIFHTSLPLQNVCFTDDPEVLEKIALLLPDYDTEAQQEIFYPILTKMLDFTLRSVFKATPMPPIVEELSKHPRVQDWLTKLIGEKSVLKEDTYEAMYTFRDKITTWCLQGIEPKKQLEKPTNNATYYPSKRR